jgi:hypothetical protein
MSHLGRGSSAPGTAVVAPVYDRRLETRHFPDGIGADADRRARGGKPSPAPRRSAGRTGGQPSMKKPSTISNLQSTIPFDGHRRA